MPESDETQQDIKEIKWHVENVDNKIDSLIRGNQEAIEEYAELFSDDPKMAKVYLAIDGSKNQGEISEETGVSTSTVSRKIEDLSRYGLVQKKAHNSGAVYMKDDLYDILRLDEKVDPEIGWNAD